MSEFYHTQLGGFCPILTNIPGAGPLGMIKRGYNRPYEEST